MGRLGEGYAESGEWRISIKCHREVIVIVIEIKESRRGRMMLDMGKKSGAAD